MGDALRLGAYNPSSRTWTPAGSMNVARCRHLAAPLPTGQVPVMWGAGTWAVTHARLVAGLKTQLRPVAWAAVLRRSSR
jgi:hypothetical protein